jgi:hypothetical protein
MEGNIMYIQFAYAPYVHIPKFLEGEWRDTSTFMEWNVYKNLDDVKQLIIKNHLGHMW